MPARPATFRDSPSRPLFSIPTQQQVPQQIGFPPKEMQQEQPASQQAHKASQHDCSIRQQAASPLQQVMQQPFSVNSHLVCPQHRLHWKTT
ncbi:MAG: hypothetical protein ACKN81_20710 [Pirellulaceae bacterium]